jgi:hypothetical protein
MTKEELDLLLAKPGYSIAPGMARQTTIAPALRFEVVPPAPAPPKSRIRQQTGPLLNKTEAAFYEYLKGQRPGASVLPQSITLKIGNGVRYTPDFAVVSDATNGHRSPVCEFHFYEVKGFMRDDAAVKLKVAASLYPLFGFHLVTKRPKKLGGGWDIQNVLP